MTDHKTLSLARSLADMDGKLDAFEHCWNHPEDDERMGTFMHYMTRADDLRGRLRTNGYFIAYSPGLNGVEAALAEIGNG